MITQRPVVFSLAAFLLAAPIGLAQDAGSLPVMPGPRAPEPAAWPSVTGPSLRVAVSVPPLKGLIEPLLPAGSTVTMLIAPGRSEHGYEFTPAELASLAQADLVIYVGLNLEPKIERIVTRHASPQQRVVCFAQAVGLSLPADVAQPDNHDHHDHADHDHDHDHADHDHDHDHDHRIDPHLWLDPVLCQKLVPALATEVKAILAAKGGTPESVDPAAAALDARVQLVDQSWVAGLAPFKDGAFVTHHDAFSRPASRYGLRIASVVRSLETADPTPAQLAGVVEAIRSQHVKTLFVEPQFDPKAAQRIAKAANVNLARLDPLGDGDWFKLMHANLEALTQGLAK